MGENSDIFRQHYEAYRDQVARVDLTSVKDIIGLESDGSKLYVQFYNNQYYIIDGDLVDKCGNRPDYMVSVIIDKYILLCPEQCYLDAEWASFKDFKKVSHFTNVNFFSTDTEKAIEKHFAGKLNDLEKTCIALEGFRHDMETRYDLAMRFNALPRVSLLLLFNDGDDEFPAQCNVLFQRQAEYYLDPESLAMTGAFLARSLKLQDLS